MRKHHLGLAIFAWILLGGAACSATPANPIWQPAELGNDFFSLPFPLDARTDAEGHPDLTGFPGNDKLLVQRYLHAISTEVVGFGRNSAVYFRFDRALDTDDIPSAADSMKTSAAIQLIDIDPNSPDEGMRIPVAAAFRTKANRYIGENYLAVMPYPGFPLREETTYAVIITTSLAAQSSGFAAHLQASAPVDDGSGRTADLHKSFAPLRAYLATDASLEADAIAVATVFTTRQSNQSLRALAQYVANTPAPTTDEFAFDAGNAYFRLYRGHYTAPNFQQGAIPYNTENTGYIEFDENGLPIVAVEESLRVAISVPTSEMPAGGWPIIIYSHGTSGSVDSFVTERLALRYANLGYAMISMDQVLHGPRNPGGDPQISFFNYFNPYAARDNVLQGSVDLMSLRKLVDTLDFTEENAMPPRPCFFDTNRVYFIGHSQGALTGTPFLANEPRLAGAIISGGGSLFYISATKKVEPIDIPSLIASALGESIVEDFHPVLALAQTWIDPADPINYGGPITHASPDRAPYPIFMIEGIGDSYTPNPGAEALATSMSIPQLAPTLHDIEGLRLRGLVPAVTPLHNNVNDVTMALGQYQPYTNDDGHFVLFDHEDAKRQSNSFFASLASSGVAIISP